MGVHENVDYERFPKQGRALNSRVRVCFHYHGDRLIGGVCVRNDVESPFLTIIKLDDGRHVIDTECQYGVERLHIFAYCDCDWIIAHDVADAVGLYADHVGEPPAFPECFRQYDAAHPIAIVLNAAGEVAEHGSEGAVRTTKTCGEWVAKFGRRFLASTEV